MSVIQYLCGPCLAEKAEIEGVVYCKECEEPLCAQCKQDHSRIKVSKHHKLCDLADVPPQEIQELLKNLIACPNHENEEVVYLCKDHDMTCCNKCVMADHRMCDEVKVLSDILNDIKVDCTGLKIVLHDFQQQGERLLEHERNHKELVFEIENQALASLQTIKQKLLDIYAQLENEVLSSIADKKKVIGDKIKRNNDNARQFFNEIKQQSTYIEQVEKFGTNEQLVLLQRQLDKNSCYSTSRPEAGISYDDAGNASTDVLLKTAVAEVGYAQYTASANILLDEGAQRMASNIGYFLSGPGNQRPSQARADYVMNVMTLPPNSINKDRFWTLDSIGKSADENDETVVSVMEEYQKTHISSKMSNPSDLNDLTSILVKFRLNEFAASTDIEKAFLHIGLQEFDKEVARFLWLGDPSDVDIPLQTYRFKTVLFWATCSPFY
ncbi:uncharacterized protein LOC127840006 [Dreissena polymorpha]|uniref:uncharacterized protein LOC127840006 n=1 Tax=Dreissena polymorpha TaxID=45954 RepID=UPI002263C5DA|nr:uncharacterized protein LOC127840006 [Dreissena polymorpha]